MAGRGPAPKEDRRRANEPERGEWTRAPGSGWRFGEPPSPPRANHLRQGTKDAWRTWMSSWFAAFWTPEDLPGLRMVAILYDAVERGDLTRSSELRQMMDNYGITPKGQQDRRWKRPDPPESPSTSTGSSSPRRSAYAHLRPVPETR